MYRTAITQEEINPYFLKYIEKVDESIDLVDGYIQGGENTHSFFKSITIEKQLYRYAEGKWNIKEVLQHLIDTERIFAYRILRIARGDKTPLQGFDQDVFIEPSGADAKQMDNLLGEYKTTREASLALIKSLQPQDLAEVGTASKGAMSARAAAFIILGHDMWHMDVIREKYL